LKTNKLNDLDGKTWMKFTKSWFIHNPPPRSKEQAKHPAKFPESLAQEFIEFFTKNGESVLDPMMGVGSALVAAVRCGRRGYGVELNEEYYEQAARWLTRESIEGDWCIWPGDAKDIVSFWGENQFNYLITSPPYWTALRRPAVTERRKEREADKEQDAYYSEDPADVGNIEDYDEFLDSLVAIYTECAKVLKPEAYATIIVKNLREGPKIHTLAWDLAKRLDQETSLKFRGEMIYCQNNIKLYPFGIYSAYVSNVHHHYCLNFRKEE